MYINSGSISYVKIIVDINRMLGIKWANDVCIYNYVYIYIICMCVYHIHLYTCIYMNIHIHTHVCMSCIYTYMYVCSSLFSLATISRGLVWDCISDKGCSRERMGCITRGFSIKHGTIIDGWDYKEFTFW